MAITPLKLVLGILASQGRNKFSHSSSDIHSAFAQLKEENADLFKDFIFAKGVVHPWSSRLEQILFELRHTGTIQTHFGFTDGVGSCRIPEASLFEELDIPCESKERIQNLGRRFAELCPAESKGYYWTHQ